MLKEDRNAAARSAASAAVARARAAGSCGVDLKLDGQPHDLVAHDAVLNDKATLEWMNSTWRSAGSASAARISRSKTNAHATCRAMLERIAEGSMVEVAQIAAKPDQGACVFRHGACGSL